MFATVVTSIQGYLPRSGIFSVMSLAIFLFFPFFLYGWHLYTLHRRLRHVPGPWLSKLSYLNLGFYDLLCCRNDQILKWHRQYGPVVCIGPNEVSVATLEGTKEIYGATHRWAKSSYFDHFLGYDMRSVFATKPYEEHRTKRSLTSAFYQASTLYKVPEIEQHIQERSQAVLGQIQPGQDIDVYSLAGWYALDNITYLAFGPDHCTRSVECVCPERDLLLDLKCQQFLAPFSVRCPKIYAYLSRVFGYLSPRLGYLLADMKLASWCQQPVFEAMNDPCLSKSRSLLRHLLEILETRGSMKPLDHRYVAAEVLDNIGATEGTIAVTATYLIWRLSGLPQWQLRIRKELTALPVQADGLVSFSDIDSKVPSLEACLREVYRLHPASSGRAERVVPHGGHEFSGVHLLEGTIVATSVIALHRDEDIFPEPGRLLLSDGSTRTRRL